MKWRGSQVHLWQTLRDHLPHKPALDVQHKHKEKRNRFDFNNTAEESRMASAKMYGIQIIRGATLSLTWNRSHHAFWVARTICSQVSWILKGLSSLLEIPSRWWQVSWSAHNPITICIGGTACLLFHRMFLHTKSRPLGIQKLSSSSSSDSSAKRCITTSYSRRETYETRSGRCSRKLCTEHGAVRRIRQVSSAEACNPSPDEWFGPDGYLALCRC